MSKPADGPRAGDVHEQLRRIDDRLTSVEQALDASAGASGRRGLSLRRGGGGGSVEQRLAEVEAELQESRRLNMRLAELTDIVQELLLPIAQQDQELLADRLKRYSASL